MRSHAARHGVPAVAIIFSTLFSTLLLLSLVTLPGYATSSTTITVNSTQVPRVVQDGKITLDEAILLANGDPFLWNSLDPNERAQVTCDPAPCTPGASSADTIRFDPGVFPVAAPAFITVTSALPALTGGFDVIDGTDAGVILDGLNSDLDTPGLEIRSDGNTIRALQIVRFYGPGILIRGNNNRVTGNLIGLTSAGLPGYGNAESGVRIEAGSEGNWIGGVGDQARNVISGNGYGILIAGANANVIAGNYIGTNRDGTGSLGNQQAGIWIGGNAHDNRIGGTGGARNLIFGNRGAGIFVTGNSTRYNTLARNLTDDNGSLGIDLAPVGPTANDPDDIDLGPNDLLNYPEFRLATMAQIRGSACLGCIVELYKASQEGGYGQGLFFVTSTTADVHGVFTFTNPGLAYGTWATATATDNLGNTSEFAANVQVGGPRACSQPWSDFPDFDGSGRIGIEDVMRVTARWQAAWPDPPYLDDYDLNQDHLINASDIQAVLNHWREECVF